MTRKAAVDLIVATATGRPGTVRRLVGSRDQRGTDYDGTNKPERRAACTKPTPQVGSRGPRSARDHRLHLDVVDDDAEHVRGPGRGSRANGRADWHKSRRGRGLDFAIVSGHPELFTAGER